MMVNSTNQRRLRFLSVKRFQAGLDFVDKNSKFSLSQVTMVQIYKTEIEFD